MYYSPLTLLTFLSHTYSQSRADFFVDCGVAKRVIRRFGKKKLADSLVLDSLPDCTRMLFIVCARSPKPLVLLGMLQSHYQRLNPGSSVMIDIPSGYDRDKLSSLAMYDRALWGTSPDALVIEGQQGYLRRSYDSDIRQLLA